MSYSACKWFYIYKKKDEKKGRIIKSNIKSYKPKCFLKNGGIRRHIVL